MTPCDNKSAICLLIEKHYHYGAAALINSLVACGYRGSVWIAYRGDLPPWTAGKLEDCPQGKLMRLGDDLLVYFHFLETDSHFKYKKAEFLKWTVENSPVPLERIFYCDADLVFLGEWTTFVDWVNNGVAVCQDMVPINATHPRRRGWQRFCQARNQPWLRDLETYINSGFLGLPKAEFSFIEKWDLLCDLVIEYLPDGDKRTIHTPDVHIRRPDQDALNMAIACSTNPVSVVGLDGMGFAPGGQSWLAHSTGRTKAWQTNYLARALFEGKPPTFTEKQVERFFSGPVQAFAPGHLKLRAANINVAAAIGRFYRRSFPH